MATTQRNPNPTLAPQPASNTVREMMTRTPLVVSPRTPVHEAHTLMQQQHIRHLPVLENGRVVGIVNESDIHRVLPSPATSLAVHEIGYLLTRLTVAEIMAYFPLTIGAERSCEEAVKRMLTYKIDVLLVVENEHLQGILTRTDILQAIAQTQASWSVAA